MRSDLHEANRLSWNAATRAHNSHKADQAAFFRNGGSTLYPEELQLLGHLDGLRPAASAMQRRTGQPEPGAPWRPRHRGRHRRQRHRLRPPAVPRQRHRRRLPARRHPPLAARRRHPRRTLRTGLRLLRHAGLALRPQALGRRHRPGTGSRRALRPGGVPPFALYFDPHWQPAYDYFSREPIAESGVSDYVAESGASLAPSGYRAGVENFSNPHPSYEFQWGLADVIGALLGAGLQLERLEEYPYANGWAGFDGMRDGGGGRMLPPADRPRLPLMYGLSARKPR